MWGVSSDGGEIARVTSNFAVPDGPGPQMHAGRDAAGAPVLVKEVGLARRRGEGLRRAASAHGLGGSKHWAATRKRAPRHRPRRRWQARPGGLCTCGARALRRRCSSCQARSISPSALSSLLRSVSSPWRSSRDVSPSARPPETKRRSVGARAGASLLRRSALVWLSAWNSACHAARAGGYILALCVCVCAVFVGRPNRTRRRERTA